MNLYVWEDVLCDYTCGMVCVLAADLEQAHTKIAEKYGDLGIPGLPTHVVTEPEAFAAYGGG